MLLSLALTLVPPAFGQPKKESKPATPVAGEPILATPVTFGIAPDAKALELTGTNLEDAESVVILGTATPIVGTRDPQKKSANRFTFDGQVRLAPIGLHQLRVRSRMGLSAYRPIVIDSLPAIEDNGTNETVAKAQPIELNRVVVGSIASEAADFYRFQVKAGQTVAFDCFARRLGSPLDPMIVLFDARTGREYPSLAADDTPGLQADARLVHTFPADGDYAIAVRDTTYKGGEAYRYRLRITVGPAAMMAYPPFATRGDAVSYSFLSQNGVAIPARTERDVQAGWLPTSGDAWPVPVWPHEGTPTVEVEPNNEIKSANPLPPGGVTARFEQKKDRDMFSLAVRKGEAWTVVARTAEIGSPCEVFLTIRDEKGGKLAESDPTKPTARAEFTAPADGTCFVDCEPLNYQHGPFEVYHLRAAKGEKTFAATAGTDRLAIPDTSFGLLPITAIERKNGFEGPIVLNVKVDDAEGSATIMGNPTKENPAYLPIRTKRSSPFMLTVPRVSAADVVRSGLNGLPHLPPGWGEPIATVRIRGLDVAVKPPASVDLRPGATARLKISVDRRAFDGDITLSLLGLPANVTAKAAALANGSQEMALEIVADGKAEAITRSLYVKAEGGGFTTHAGPIEMTITKTAEAPMSGKPAIPTKKKE